MSPRAAERSTRIRVRIHEETGLQGEQAVHIENGKPSRPSSYPPLAAH
jgi:hypothetical protein